MAASTAVIERCLALARFSEEPDRLTRTFLSVPTHDVHRLLQSWMDAAGMAVSIDSIGNLHGLYAGGEGARFIVGSHIDTVPGAGAYDGVLGVVMGIALVESLGGRQLGFPIELVAFSEEEGVRYGVPFLGSRALVGTLDTALIELVSPAVRAYGLDPSRIGDAALSGDVRGYLEFHIEQGPVLESLDLPLGIVDTIAGQTRLELSFTGSANHAGTTPMDLRHDALAAAAEWIVTVERIARETAGLVATVGSIEARPGATNVIAGSVRASLDVRHAFDDVRERAVHAIVAGARNAAERRGVEVRFETRLNQAAVACDPDLVRRLAQAVDNCGYPLHRMPSGAGHDAMIMAQRMPMAMLFVRSPGGISHHPDESVVAGDIDAALAVGRRFLEELDRG